MLITRIELENIKSYRHIVIELRQGTTAISGANGAGKTTIVEAIGYALFDYLSYNQNQFVREGAKYGRVSIRLIGSDDRPYVVERRCGSGSRWSIYDEEAAMQHEQRADVLDKLHDLFGIDRERPLDSLFRDALGVPQGTFTSIFLESPAKRKQTFDALLQIEDYKLAADYLLEVQKEYKEQMLAQQTEINRLSYETRDLEAWQSQLVEAQRLAVAYHEQLEQGKERLLTYRERHSRLTAQESDLRTLRQQYEHNQQSYQHNQMLLQEREQRVQHARMAQSIFMASTPAYQRYQQASAALKRLRTDEQQRAKIQQLLIVQQREQATAQANSKNWQSRLSEVTAARQRIRELEPRVQQQEELEQQLETLKEQVARYKAVVDQGKRLSRQFAETQEKLNALQTRIAEIEPLQELARQFSERGEYLTQLRMREVERANKEELLKAKQQRLTTCQNERRDLNERFRKAEQNVRVIEEHRSQAEEMPHLQSEYEQAVAVRSRLEGNIEAYEDSRRQSAGGQCPLLREACLNIKQRGVVSLESYFDGLLQTERVQLVTVRQQQQRISERREQIKKYADALLKLDQYLERRDTLAEQLRKRDEEVAVLDGELATLTQEIAALGDITQQVRSASAAYEESKRADAQVHELSGLYKQVQEKHEQIQQEEATLQELRREAEGLKGCEASQKQVEIELQRLQNPRARLVAQQSIVAGEEQFRQKWQEEQRRLDDIQRQMLLLQEQLAPYVTLDSDVAMQQLIVQQSEEDYRRYLQNEKEAHLLPQREQEHQEQNEKTQAAYWQLESSEQAYRSADAAFDANELADIVVAIRQLDADLVALDGKSRYHQESISQLKQQIEKAELLRQELATVEREYQTLEDLHTMTTQFRTIIKEAAPHVLKAMLNDISAEANRIFNEIMGDRSAQLSWQNDYEITLRRQAVNRTFAQLSGGEQMSAALAVRLALLKKLSTLNIAFFDEPTQNMDEMRRMNLAEQIRRVRGFDQLIVISHDDTFEQGLDSIVRLNKVEGETRLLSEEEIRFAEGDSLAAI